MMVPGCDFMMFLCFSFGHILFAFLTDAPNLTYKLSIGDPQQPLSGTAETTSIPVYINPPTSGQSCQEASGSNSSGLF